MLIDLLTVTFQGQTFLSVHDHRGPFCHREIFPFDKRVLGGHDLSKKGLTLKGHCKLVKWALKQNAKKNPTFIFADLFLVGA